MKDNNKLGKKGKDIMEQDCSYGRRRMRREKIGKKRIDAVDHSYRAKLRVW